METHVLLINCRDAKGLVHKITGVLYRYELNVVCNDEYVERKFNQFFMRTEFSGEFDRESLLKELYNALPANVEIKLTDKRKKNIVILATKEHHCLSDLLVRHEFGELNANILCVISNHNILESLCYKFEIPFQMINHEEKSREEHEKEVLYAVQQYNPEFVVLAKYMRILSKEFIAPFQNRIVNIHHSFLPAFVGANPYVQAYERGVKIIGATAHFVNEELDQGPIIAQSVIPVDHTHNAWEMAQAGRDVEKTVLAKALKLIFNEQVFIYQNKTIIF